MGLCCPPRHGCNSSAHDELCVLDLCDRLGTEVPEACTVLERWKEWRTAREQGHNRRERRFRRRAYERSRDRALAHVLITLPRSTGGALAPAPSARFGTALRHYRPGPGHTAKA